MKVGDMIKIVDNSLYPRLKGKVGVLIRVPRSQLPNKWAVMIGGRIHPYTIAEEDMEVINESR
jgi:hypothetical protein